MDQSFGYVIFSPTKGWYQSRLDIDEAEFSMSPLECAHFELLEQAQSNLAWIQEACDPDAFVMQHGMVKV